MELLDGQGNCSESMFHLEGLWRALAHGQFEQNPSDWQHSRILPSDDVAVRQGSLSPVFMPL